MRRSSAPRPDDLAGPVARRWSSLGRRRDDDRRARGGDVALRLNVAPCQQPASLSQARVSLSQPSVRLGEAPVSSSRPSVWPGEAPRSSSHLPVSERRPRRGPRRPRGSDGRPSLGSSRPRFSAARPSCSVSRPRRTGRIRARSARCRARSLLPRPRSLCKEFTYPLCGDGSATRSADCRIAYHFGERRRHQCGNPQSAKMSSLDVGPGLFRVSGGSQMPVSGRAEWQASAVAS